MRVRGGAVLAHLFGCGDAYDAAVLVLGVLAVPELVQRIDLNELVEVVYRCRVGGEPLQDPPGVRVLPFEPK